jgi:hypothetical protein
MEDRNDIPGIGKGVQGVDSPKIPFNDGGVGVGCLNSRQFFFWTRTDFKMTAGS